MAYENPFSVADPDTTWTNEINTINGDDANYGYESVPAASWSGFLEFTCEDGEGLVSCDKVQIDAIYIAVQNISQVDIDTSDDGGDTWDDRYEGVFDHEIWWEHEFGSTLSINKYRVRFYNSHPSSAKLSKFYATQWNEAAVGGNAPTGVLYGSLAGCLGGPL